jgi:hypothetical protein
VAAQFAASQEGLSSVSKGHILIRELFLVLVCGTRVHNLSARFSSTIYIYNERQSDEDRKIVRCKAKHEYHYLLQYLIKYILITPVNK